MLTPQNKNIPSRTVERLVLYKRMLADFVSKGGSGIYSHQLAALADNSPAQVRRDLMAVGVSGNPKRGYDAIELIGAITNLLESESERKIALVGIGNLGRAILSYFTSRHIGLVIAAAFDSDESKTNRVISGCRCYHMDEFEERVSALGVKLGIITVPAVYAQEVADRMTDAGIKGILNFAPVPLKLPRGTASDRIDIASTLEKLSYFTEHSE